MLKRKLIDAEEEIKLLHHDLNVPERVIVKEPIVVRETGLPPPPRRFAGYHYWDNHYV